MEQHTVRAYDEELDAITAELARMGGLAEAEVADAIRAIAKSDVPLAISVISRDAKLDVLDREIERRAIRLIALRQPVADDLRHTVAAMKISINLERMRRPGQEHRQARPRDRGSRARSPHSPARSSAWATS